MTDGGARLARHHELQPLRAGRGRWCGDDLDRLPRGEARVQRLEFAIHPCGHRVRADIGVHGKGKIERSEEHTSELQSLMRISYAVFCLKKKNTSNKTNTLQ